MKLSDLIARRSMFSEKLKTESQLTRTGHDWPELSNSLSKPVSVGWRPSGVDVLAGAGGGHVLLEPTSA